MTMYGVFSVYIHKTCIIEENLCLLLSYYVYLFYHDKNNPSLSFHLQTKNLLGAQVYLPARYISLSLANFICLIIIIGTSVKIIS